MGITRQLLSIIVLFVSICSMATVAQAGMRVLVLPLNIQGHEGTDISGIRREFMETFAATFEEEGSTMVGIDTVRRLVLGGGVKNFDESLAMKIAGEVGADIILLGDIDKVQDTIKINWRVVDTYSGQVLLSFSKDDEDKDRLLEETSLVVGAVHKKAQEYIEERPVEMEGNLAMVSISGNHRVDDEAVLRRLISKTGGTFSSDDVREDVNSIYNMGYFDDVIVELTETISGKRLTFVVKERPYVKKIEIKGREELSEDKIKEMLTIKENTILNEIIISENIEKIKALYASEGYFLADAQSEVAIDGQEAAIVFNIKEGDKVKVRRVTIIGNEVFSDDDIKDVMKTKEVGIFSRITGSGSFDEPLFKFDLQSVKFFYYDNGYIEAEIKDASVLLSEDKRWFYITIVLKEGDQFSFGKVDVAGDILTTKEELILEADIPSGETFSRKVLGKGINAVKAIYGDKGYAIVGINPKTFLDQDKKTVDITFMIDQGPLVYVERLNIVGNTKTRDKVIRREIEVEEGDLYSLTGLKRSKNRVSRLGFFDGVDIRERPGSSKDKVVLDVEVTERPTGQISLGLGYSSVDKIIGTLSLSQSNLFGTGLKLDLSGTRGSASDRYQIGFTEPWLMGKPISAGFDLYKSYRQYPDFDRDSDGFDIRFGFPIYGWDTKGYLTYKDERIAISNVDEGSTFKDQEGDTTTKSITGTIRRDTRDDAFFPREGSKSSLSIEYAGDPLGGDNDFIMYIANAVKFFPLPWDTTISMRGILGFIEPFNDSELPIYQRFYLGGANTIRGFKIREVGPKDPDTGEFIGGDREVVFNTEFLFPLMPEQRVRGLLFFDAGNSYRDKIDLNDLRTSVGIGIRWYSPVGPLRLEWGYNLGKRDGEKASQFEFSLGARY